MRLKKWLRWHQKEALRWLLTIDFLRTFVKFREGKWSLATKGNCVGYENKLFNHTSSCFPHFALSLWCLKHRNSNLIKNNNNNNNIWHKPKILSKFFEKMLKIWTSFLIKDLSSSLTKHLLQIIVCVKGSNCLYIDSFRFKKSKIEEIKTNLGDKECVVLAFYFVQSFQRSF